MSDDRAVPNPQTDAAHPRGDRSVPASRPGTDRASVLTYMRRGGRFTPTQQREWDEHAAGLVVPDEVAREGRIEEWFDRPAPLILEIGAGVGESVVRLAALRPEANVLAVEVWRPGVATAVAAVAAAGLDNVRFCCVDAVWLVGQHVAPGGLAELWTFFPDPWPKNRHHKRRLVNPGFAATVAQRLQPDGWWRLATDQADYAGQIERVLAAEPLLSGGRVPRWADRPLTRFERKGLRAGREIHDFGYRRCTPGEAGDR